MATSQTPRRKTPATATPDVTAATTDAPAPKAPASRAGAPRKRKAAEPAKSVKIDKAPELPAESAKPPRSRRSPKPPAPHEAPATAKPKRSAKPPPAPAASAKPVDDTVRDVLALLVAEAPAAGISTAAPVPAPEVPAPAPTGPADSQIVLLDGDRRQVAWLPGHACPTALRQAAQQQLDAGGHLAADNDTALPLLMRLAAEAHHPLRVDEAVWSHLAAHRDARTRLQTLEAAYPQGPASPALAGLLRVPLPLYQAEGALFAVVAGRALIADERGLGKSVQAIAAATLWQRHFGVRRVLVLCAPSQRGAWQRAWQRFAGRTDVDAPQLMDGGLHQRQALWSTDAGVRILSPEALDSDAAHIAHWAPDLIIVDEPQQLAMRDSAWRQLEAPHALVLCGAPLAELPALMGAIVDWLDLQRQGPLAALHLLQSASDEGRGLDDETIERVTLDLSRLMLQRLRADLADQLPPLVHTERLLPLAPGQREAHDRAFVLARRLVDGWQRSGYLSDGDQWRLSAALREMQVAAHRADPADPHSALAEATVQALIAQLDDWDGTAAPRVAVLCATEADRAQLAQRLAPRIEDGSDAAVQLVAPGDPVPDAADVVLQVGVPWRPRRNPAGPRGAVAPGQQWVYLVAQHSLDAGLFDTLAQRVDAPRGLADGGGRSYLQGERLTDWLIAVQAALAATEASAAA